MIGQEYLTAVPAITSLSELLQGGDFGGMPAEEGPSVLSTILQAPEFFMRQASQFTF